MKALVTGGAGFLGRHLVRELLKQGIETIVYDRALPPKMQEEATSAGVTYVVGDILDQDKLSKSMEGCNLVFHTAAIAEIDETRRKPVSTMEVNVVGTASCLEAARDNGVERFLFTSTVYTSGNQGSFYRVSKQAGESLCKTFFKEFGLKYTILKYGSLYGRDANHWNFMYTVCRALLQDGVYTYRSSPDAIREYIHIYDAARETIRIAQDSEFINKSVLITGHQRMKMSDLFEAVEEIMDGHARIEYVCDEQQCHYIRTPYSFDIDVPVRINLSTYIDIHEGILDCLQEIRKEMEVEERSGDD